MPELILFAHDHPTIDPTLTVTQVAALPSLYDLIDLKPDDWKWGSDEISHPWFRILAWPHANQAELETLLSPLLPTLDVDDMPTTLWQYHGHYLDIDSVITKLPDLGSFWNDKSRKGHRFVIPKTFTDSIASLTKARKELPDPNYYGLGDTTIKGKIR